MNALSEKKLRKPRTCTFYERTCWRKTICQLSTANTKLHKTELQMCHSMNTTSGLKICWKPAGLVAFSGQTLTFTLSCPSVAKESLTTGRNTDLVLQKGGAVTEVAQAITFTVQATRRTSCIGGKAQLHSDTAKTKQLLVCRAVPQVRMETPMLFLSYLLDKIKQRRQTVQIKELLRNSFLI